MMIIFYLTQISKEINKIMNWIKSKKLKNQKLKELFFARLNVLVLRLPPLANA